MNAEKNGLKGQQATEHNKRNYAAYVAKLKATGESFRATSSVRSV